MPTSPESGCCTWVECQNVASVPQIAKDGEQWANLCAAHDAEINAGLEALDAKKLLSCWVKAMGGAKAATRRMMR